MESQMAKADPKAKKEDEKALATTGTTALSTEVDYGDDSGAGYENQTQQDTTVPFIVLLQGLSPQCNDEDRNPPVRPGQWFNTATDQAWTREEGFLFVPSTTKHVFAEWTPRKDGGGFHGHHAIDSDIVKSVLEASAKKFGKMRFEAVEHDKDDREIKKIHELIETFYVWGVVCSPEGHPEGPACIAFSSTKIRPYKGWQTRIQQIRMGNGKRPPLYAHLTKFTSLKESNDEGEFYVPRISSGNPAGIRESLLTPDDPRFLAAKEYKRLLEAGVLKTNYAGENGAPADGSTYDEKSGTVKGADGKEIF